MIGSMEFSDEALAQIKEEFDQLTKKAASTDQRIETVKKEVAQVKEQATQVQKRLRGS